MSTLILTTLAVWMILIKPMTPIGVEHTKTRSMSCKLNRLIKPMTPIGVEHTLDGETETVHFF